MHLTQKILSIIIFIILSPLLGLICGTIIVSNGSPILYKSKRAGKNGTQFTLYKFRTMRNKPNLKSDELSDSLRITRLGSLLRKTSLDELPSLINIIKGDMSFVGPRPLLPDYLLLYNSEQFRRHEVLPGITGFAQINGRNAISWEEKFKLDVWYVDNRNLLLDIKIILKTVYKVIKRENINQDGHATMPMFKGSK
jgi:sugar transferase EpsL